MPERSRATPTSSARTWRTRTSSSWAPSSGLFISVDGGAAWARFTGGDFPKVAVRDIAIHPRDADLILATHGRGIYILDDITPLRKLTRDVLEQEVAFLPSRPAPMVIPVLGPGLPGRRGVRGPHPRGGGHISLLPEEAPHRAATSSWRSTTTRASSSPPCPAGKRKGINRVAWPMRMKAPRTPGGNAVIQAPSPSSDRACPPAPTRSSSPRAARPWPARCSSWPTRGPRTSPRTGSSSTRPRSRLHAMMERLTYVVDATLGARDALRKRAEGLPQNDKLRKQLDGLAGRADEAPRHARGHGRGRLAVWRGAAP